MDGISQSLSKFALRRNSNKQSDDHYLFQSHRIPEKSLEDAISNIEFQLKKVGIDVYSIRKSGQCHSIRLKRPSAISYVFQNFNLPSVADKNPHASVDALVYPVTLTGLLDTRIKIAASLFHHLLTFQPRGAVNPSYSRVFNKILDPTSSDEKPSSDIFQKLLSTSKHITKSEHSLDLKLPQSITIEGLRVQNYSISFDSPTYTQLLHLTHLIGPDEQTDQVLKMYLFSLNCDVYKCRLLALLLENLYSLKQTAHQNTASQEQTRKILDTMNLLTVQIVIVGVTLPPTNSPQSCVDGEISRIRSELEEATKQKCEDVWKVVQTDSEMRRYWEDRIDNLTLSAVTFELLTKSLKANVRMSSSDSKIGPFVMYNSARLSTLFSSFEDRVTCGYYPPLPPQSEINLSLLKTQDEWVLVFHHLNVFPALVHDLLTSGSTADLHKLPVHLHQMSRDLSTYYSRTHILGENAPHCLPVMYARLLLLKSIQEIYQLSFTLLGLKLQRTM